MTMRKGFTLVEMLVIVIILPFVFVLVDGLFRTLIKDIPQSYSIVQENTTLLDMLEQVQQDIDRATDLPKSYDGLAAGDDLLLVELADGVISYQLKDGRAVRRRLAGLQAETSEQQRTWKLPHARITWRIWTKDDRRYAVEARTHMELKIRGKWKEKMAGSHLFFAGAS